MTSPVRFLTQQVCTGEYIAENTPVLQAAQVQDYDALLVLGAGITAETFTAADRLAVIARFGVGYDKVDVGACIPKMVYC